MTTTCSGLPETRMKRRSRVPSAGSRRYHADRSKDPGAGDRFKEIAEACAMLGTTARIPTLGPPVRMKVTPGGHPGSVVRVAGKGLPVFLGKGVAATSTCEFTSMCQRRSPRTSASFTTSCVRCRGAPGGDRRCTRSRSRICSRATARSTPSAGSASGSGTARCSRCSDRTAPGRPRRSRSSRATGAAAAARCRCWGWTRRSAAALSVSGSASCCSRPASMPS